MQTYESIQDKYAHQMMENKDWSVFMLPEVEDYFSFFVPAGIRPFYSKEQIQHHIEAVAVTSGESKLYKYSKWKLMEAKDMFGSYNVSKEEYEEIVEDVANRYNSGELTLESVPNNARCASVHNPYYIFPEDSSNEDKNEIRRKHRNKLRRDKNHIDQEDSIREAIMAYDISKGMLKQKYVLDDAEVSKYVFTQAISRNVELQEMFLTIKAVSTTEKQKQRKKWNQNQNQNEK